MSSLGRDTQSPIASALPDWPRTERSRDNWIGLHKHGFFFTHEPSFEVDDESWDYGKIRDYDDFDARRDYFCVPSEEYQKLRSVLEHSKGGSVLVTGYRGTGKSSLVKYTIHRLKQEYNTNQRRRVSPAYLDIRLNLSSVSKAEQVLPMMFKAFHEAVCIQRELSISPLVRREVAQRYQNSIYTQKQKTLASVPIGYGKSSGVEKEVERSTSTVAELQADLFKCIDLVFGFQIKTVFIFDEIDKIQAGADRKAKSHERLKQLQDIVGELKFILTESNAYHIFVAGKDVDDSWQEDQNKGEGLFESIFTLNIYLSSFFTPRLDYTLGPHRRWVLKNYGSVDSTVSTEERPHDKSLYDKVFKRKELRWLARTFSAFIWIKQTFIKLLLTITLALIFWGVFSSLYNSLATKTTDFLGVSTDELMPVLIFLPSIVLGWKLSSFVLRGSPNPKRRTKIKLTRFTKPAFIRWKREKRNEETRELGAAQERELTNTVISILASEIGISRKNWSFRTALLILPHLAEYEIEGLLMRRLIRIRKGVLKNQDCFERQSEIEGNILERLVGHRVPISGNFGNCREIGLPSERKVRRLRLFIQYATYKGRGIPRKILREFYSFVRHRSILKEKISDFEYWDKRDNIDFIFDIPYPIQQKMSFFADITCHLERHLKFFRNLDDKGIVSTFHIVDFMLKFYETGFNRRDIYNANFMVRRLELFPSEALVERVLDLFSGFLISPLGRTIPEFRLLPKIQTDLAKLYLSFGPDQLELRFTKAEFINELDELEGEAPVSEGQHHLRRIDSFRTDSRRGRIYELIGDYFEARKCYSRAVRWVFEDYDNILKRESELEIQRADIIDRGRSLSFTSQAMLLLCRLARVHEIMHEFHESLLYCNQAISIGLGNSGIYRNKAKETEIGKHSERILIAFPSYPELVDGLNSKQKTIFGNTLSSGSNGSASRVIPHGSNELLELICHGELTFRNFTGKAKEGVVYPETKQGEPIDLINALNASTLLHEKLKERSTANESLLIALFYVAASRNDYVFIDQLLFMGNLSVRRRDLPQALVAYDLASKSLNRIQYSGISRGLPLSQRTRASLICSIADIQSAYGGNAAHSMLSDAKIQDDYHGELWQFLVDVAGFGIFDTRQDEFLYAAALELYEELDDRLSVIDTHLKRLSLRVRRFRELVSPSEDDFDEFAFLECFSSILSGSCSILNRLVHATTERARLDPSAQSEVIDQRRLGRLLEIVGLSFQLIGEHSTIGEHASAKTRDCLNQVFAKKNSAFKAILKRKGDAFVREKISHFEDLADVEKSHQAFHARDQGRKKESLASAVERNSNKAVTRTLDFETLSRNLEILLSFTLAKEIDFSKFDITNPHDSRWREALRPGERSMISSLRHRNVSELLDDGPDDLLIDGLYKKKIDSSAGVFNFIECSAERFLLFSVVTYQTCIRDQGVARANLSIGRFYLRNLVDRMLHEDAENLICEKNYSWLYSAAKRFLVKSIDVFSETIGVSRRGEALLGEAYSTLADLMLLRRYALSRFPSWHQAGAGKNELKEIDDLLPVDVQGQAFRYAEEAASSYEREIHQYVENYPLPNSVHFSHKNLSDPLLHFEVCASINRRRVRKDSGRDNDTDMNKLDTIPTAARTARMNSLKSVSDPQGTRFRSDEQTFYQHFSSLLTAYNSSRYLNQFFVLKETRGKWGLEKIGRSAQYTSTGSFFENYPVGECDLLGEDG